MYQRSAAHFLTLGVAAVSVVAVTVYAAASVATVPGMPPVIDPANLYSEQAAGKVSAQIANDLQRVYVPHVKSNHNCYRNLILDQRN